MTLHIYVCIMFLESQHIVLQKFRIQHDWILSIHRILENVSDSDSESQKHNAFVHIFGGGDWRRISRSDKNV